MKKVKLMLLLAVISVSSFALSATAAVDSSALGAKVFETHCTACHDKGENVVESAKTLKSNALKENGFNSAADIKKRVESGKGVMPVFSDRLKADEIEAVANYVWEQSQKGWK